MIQNLLTIMTVMMASSVLLPPVLGVRNTVCVQLLLFPLVHVYASGLALTASFVWLLISSREKRHIAFRVPRQVAILWILWAGAVAISLVANGCTGRILFQVGEFVFYGIATVLFFNLHIQSDSAKRALAWAMAFSALLFSCVLLYLYHTYGVADSVMYFPINVSAFILVVFGIMIPVRQIRYEKKGHTVLLCTIVAVSLLTIYFSESRGAIAIGFPLAVVFLTSNFFNLHGRRLLLIAAVSLFFALRSPTVQDDLWGLFDFNRNYSNMERAALVETCLELFYEKPLTGWGWGTQEVMLPKVARSEQDYPHAHNVYAHFMAELGVAGLLFLAGLLLSFCAISWRLHVSGKEHEALFVMLSCAVVAASGLIYDYFYGAGRAIVVSVILGAVYAAGFQEERQRSSSSAKRRLGGDHAPLSRTNRNAPIEHLNARPHPIECWHGIWPPSGGPRSVVP